MSEGTYPGRGVLVGRCGDGDGVAVAVWLTGRSEASRNRRLEIHGETIVTRFLPAVAETTESTYRIYTAAHWSQRWLVAGNGDHVTSITQALEAGTAFGAALERDTFEHDPPIWTPRIVGAASLAAQDGGTYRLGEAYRSSGGTPAWLSFVFAGLAPGEAMALETYQGDPVDVRARVAMPIPRTLDDGAQEIAGAIFASLPPALRVASAAVVAVPGSPVRAAVVNAA